MISVLLFLSIFFLAYWNGANDNFKGVATLFGCQAVSYKQAIRWATVSTFLGSIFSIFLARELVIRFSGKGLVPDAIASAPPFLISVALGAGATVLLASLKGFPISTTHSLTGALVGSGVMAVGWQVNLSLLGSKFFLPLLVSPLMAAVLAGSTYLIFRSIRIRTGIAREWCLCVGKTETVLPAVTPAGLVQIQQSPRIEVGMGTMHSCRERYQGKLLGIPVQQGLHSAHLLSAGMVSFARGLNDTPKIVALLLVIQSLQIQWGLMAVGAAIALGGLVNARKVAYRMSREITQLNSGQGFSANLVTGFLVIVASRWGLPVSTTHVSVGSLFGIGTVNRTGAKRMMRQILLSWVLTLPVAMVIGALGYWVASQLVK